MFELSKPTFVSFGGYDITENVTAICAGLDHPCEPIRMTYVVPPITVRLRTRKLTPRTYRILFGQTHPRIRRMHAAYGRRRKGW